MKIKSASVKEVALMKIEGRVLVLMTAIAGLSLSGCVSSPTYGTDKTAGAQLFDDVSNMASFGQGRNKKERIDYKPRPDLVRPAPGDKGQLPAPQQSLASANDPNWPESPEQRRKRLRDEITANRDDPNFVSPVVQDGPVASIFRLHCREAIVAAKIMNPVHRRSIRRRLLPIKPHASSRLKGPPRRAVI